MRIGRTGIYNGCRALCSMLFRRSGVGKTGNVPEFLGRRIGSELGGHRSNFLFAVVWQNFKNQPGQAFFDLESDCGRVRVDGGDF